MAGFGPGGGLEQRTPRTEKKKQKTLVFSDPENWTPVPAPPLTGFVALDKSLFFSAAQFFHLENGSLGSPRNGP